MSYYNRMGVADADATIPILARAYMHVAERVLEIALSDVEREATRDEACWFFDSGEFRLYADVLGWDHDRILDYYRRVRDGAESRKVLNRPITDEERQEMIRRYEAGEIVTEIAAATGHSGGSVSKALLGIRPMEQRRQISDEEKKRIKELRNAGYSFTEIGRMVGRSHTAVSRWAGD